MTGLEKVTGKILADAEADAKEILDRAEAECAAIRERYRAEREAQLAALREQSDRECQAHIVRARSTAAMTKRNAVLEARATILNHAYTEAEKQVRSMSSEQYLDLLCKILRTALKEQLSAETDSLRLYKEDISPAVYEVILTNRDRDFYGEKLMDSFRTGLGAKLSPAVLAKLRLSRETAAIDGGLILRCGDISCNCSLTALFAQVRASLEGKVSALLFDAARG
jgi:V/A-type H+-transporting ATPase subunit E